MRRFISSALFCAALGACSSGSGGGGDVTRFVFDDDTPAVTRDLANDTYTVTADAGTPIVFKGAPAFDRGAFDHATLDTGPVDNGGGYIAVAQQEDGGRVSLVIPNSGKPLDSYVSFERAQATTIPAIGAAQFSGDYAGAIFIDEALLADTSGDAQINVDFESGTVSGQILNRIIVEDVTTNIEAIVLEPSTISEDGILAAGGGKATAGDIAFEGSTYIQSKDGEYTGVISGTDGANVLGGVEIEYTVENGGAIAQEFGAFAASQ